MSQGEDNSSSPSPREEFFDAEETNEVGVSTMPGKVWETDQNIYLELEACGVSEEDSETGDSAGHTAVASDSPPAGSASAIVNKGARGEGGGGGGAVLAAARMFETSAGHKDRKTTSKPDAHTTTPTPANTIYSEAKYGQVWPTDLTLATACHSEAKYGQLWPTDVRASQTPQAEQSESVYDLAKPLPEENTPHGPPPTSAKPNITTKATSPSSHVAFKPLSSPSTPPPTTSPPPVPTSSSLTPSSSSSSPAASARSQASFTDYSVPSSSAQTRASQPISPTNQQQDIGRGIYYLSGPVPVFEDPRTDKSDNCENFIPPCAALAEAAAAAAVAATAVTPLVNSCNRAAQSGVGGAVPVDFISPAQNQKEPGNEGSEYERLFFHSTKAELTQAQKEALIARGYRTLATLSSSTTESQADPTTRPFSSTTAATVGDSLEEDLVSLDWGSEFDEDESVDIEEVDKMLRQMDLEAATPALDLNSTAPDKPLPPKPQKHKGHFSPRNFFNSNNNSSNSNNNNDQSSQGSKETSSIFYQELDADPYALGVLPVNINPEKHPPPELPPQPAGLSDNQVKRRLIVGLIISSERSYLESLERVIKEYERAVLEFLPDPKSALRPVFREMKEIICHHKMFQIALAERVKNWDKDEIIGDIFRAAFSKTILVQAYSVFVNHFAQAMEEIRNLQRNRQAFNEFLRTQEKLGADRLSIFGLMVKPIQRFPQFIMVLQDLIKYTPTAHKDRQSLQAALTDLETIAHRLNESKRLSEQKFQARLLTRSLARQQRMQRGMLGGAGEVDIGTVEDGGGLLGGGRRLIRYDDVEQIFGDFGNMKCKPRRLILMNDIVMCVKVTGKDQGGQSVEKLDLKWVARLSDLELRDTTLTPNLQRLLKKAPGKIHLISSKLEKPEDDPFHLYADLQEMLHDFTIMEQVTNLLGTLRRSYTGHGLREELLQEVRQDLENMIHIKGEQLRVVNSCTVQLVNHSRSDKPQYVLQTQTSAIKDDWCTDLLLAKLALERNNKWAWDVPSGGDSDPGFDFMPAQFMKYVVVDRPKNYTKVRCACPVFLHADNSMSGLGVQHLWVCSSTPTHGQVSVLSIHNSRPALIEAFRACSCDIMAMVLVPGCGDLTFPDLYIFAQDTIWMATAESKILIFPLASEDGVRRDPLASLDTRDVVQALKFVDERIFSGYKDGAMSVLSRVTDGSWSIGRPTQLDFGDSPVCLHFVHEENLWISCGSDLYLVEIDSLDVEATHRLSTNRGCGSAIRQVVKTGVGVWVSFEDSAFITLYHVESMESLQEISIGSFVHRLKTEKLWTLGAGSTEKLVVTSLAESKGLLWIGTSAGVVLSLPLPRLSDGVPFYRGRPSVSLHAHRGPVQFLVALYCAANTLELSGASSLRHMLRQRQSRRNIEREKLEEPGPKGIKCRKSSIILDTLPRGNSGKDIGVGSGGSDDTDYSLAGPVCEPDNSGVTESREYSLAGGLGDVGEEQEGDSESDDEKTATVDGTVAYAISALDQWEKDSGYGVVDSVFEKSPKKEDNSAQAVSPPSQEGQLMQAGSRNSFTLGRKKKGILQQPQALLSDRTASDVVTLRQKKKAAKTLSFRSELAQRIMVTSHTLSRSQANLATEANEVEMYYDALLYDETDESGEFPQPLVPPSREDRKQKPNKKKNVAENQVSKETRKQSKANKNEDKPKRPDVLNTSTAGSTSSPSESCAAAATTKPTTSPTTGKSAAVSQSGHRVALSTSSVSPSSPTKSVSGFSRAGAGRSTMLRRANTNSAVIVLSGGDGYYDLDASRSQSKTEDACVQLWLYKY